MSSCRAASRAQDAPFWSVELLERLFPHRPRSTRFQVGRGASGEPVLKLGRTRTGLPTGWVDVEIDGDRYRANFGDDAIGEVRPSESETNALPKLVTSWFGKDAGQDERRWSVAQDVDEHGGYRWTPINQAEGRPLFGAEGGQIDARCLVEPDDDGATTIVVMSRGGGRNNAYDAGLQLILQRLAEAGWSIARIAVETRETKTLSLDERTVQLDGTDYPLAPSPGADFAALRRQIGRGMARLGRTPNAKGSGNMNKRIRIWVTGPDVDELDACVREGQIDRPARAS